MPANSPEPEAASVRAAMDEAWADHHHARDQTWKALQIEAGLVVGLIGIDVKLHDAGATLGAGILTLLATISGIGISLHHRALEIRKLTHIMNCERWLKLQRPNLICDVARPRPVHIHDVFLLWKTNTALFILRMHFTIAAFAVLYVVFSHANAASFTLLGVTLALGIAAVVVSVVRAASAGAEDAPIPSRTGAGDRDE